MALECPACGNENRDEARFCDSCGTPLTAPPSTSEADRGEAASRDGAGEAAPTLELPADAPREIAGRYAVEAFLGRGGRKRVYRARDAADDGREVAVAVFETEGVGETALARARREAQAMAKLGRHPHIVGVLDTGEDDGKPYIVSEYMAGGDVAVLLDAAAGSGLEVDRAIAIAGDLCRALEHAHARGVVHRDLKPANVWLGDDGRARLGDFGLATTEARSRQAVEGELVGTVAYLPPEQALGRTSDPRADLYSLGALLYEMTTGGPPFPGDDAVAIIGQHLNAEPVPPRRHEPTIPRGLERLILSLLAKSPDDRPPDAATVLAELERIAAEPAEEPDGADEADANPLAGLAGGVFVGREAELDEMKSSFELALAGRGGLVLLVGEPGIGKTRVAEEFATYARVRGARVHWGRCHEDEGAPAYWPWAEALRSYARDADPVGLRWELGARADELARIVPDLAEALGVPEPEPPSSDEDRFRLFDAVAGFLTDASRDRPLVLVLDDLHWADGSSLELLKFTARQLAESGLLLVATYRDVELGRHRPLAGALGELSDSGGARRIQLRGLNPDALERMIEMSTGHEAPAGLADAVWAQTEGNPFFVGEVVKLLAAEGELDRPAVGWQLAIPQGVREVVGRRLDQLSDSANEVLRLAAVCGREFHLKVLERICDRPRDEVAEALAEAVAARLVGESRREPGRYSFAHALVRETLYAETPGARRVQLNRQIGEALEGSYAGELDSHLAELAHHFAEAAPGGEVSKAVDYGERAARLAVRQLAYEEAASLYADALEALESTAAGDRDARLRLMLGLGEARTRSGQFVAARQCLERAAALARETSDREALTRAALGISAVAPTGALDEPLTALLREALEAEGEADSRARAELLSALAGQLYWRDPQGEAAPVCTEAVEIAERLDDPRALAVALQRQQFVLAGYPEAPRDRFENAGHLLDAAARAGNDDLAARAHVYRMIALVELGDVGAADRERDAFARLANELRSPQHRWHVAMHAAMWATMEGRFDDAERLAAEARRGGRRTQEPLADQIHALQMSILRSLQGRLSEALPAVREMADRYPAIPAWRLALVSFLAELGQTDEARVGFERIAAGGFDDVPADVTWTSAMTRLADACAWLGDAPRARALYRKLEPFAGLAVVAGPGGSEQGPIDLYLGRLALTTEQASRAVSHLERSLEMAGRMGDRPFIDESRYWLARALLARRAGGDTERAVELLGACLDSAQELGMRVLVERAIALRLEAQGLAGIDVLTSIEAVVEAVRYDGPDLGAIAAADGTVTILFSDIENSTLINERLGDERWLEVLRRHNDVFRARLRELGGYEVKSQGDGFMLAFGDPGAALECATAVQRDLESAFADDDTVRVRMGIHTGEAIQSEGDFFGRSVVLAARIAAQAVGGEVLVSEDLRARVGDGSGPETEWSFDDGRELELKGLAGSHRVYAVEGEAVPVA